MISSRQKQNRKPLPGRRASVAPASLLIFYTFVAITIGAQLAAFAQEGRREIVSDDFTSPRPTPTPKATKLGGIGGNIISHRVRPIARNNSKRYRLASSPPGEEPLANTGNIEQLGITIWRLRPAKATDTGARMLVMEANKPQEWIPERIEADTPLNIGDRVRLTIESPRAGYLYIVDRDLFADGTMGEAMLIFPTLNTRGADNKVAPGKLIDIPAQDDAQSYFTAKPVRSDQVGEVLSLIVTTAPLDLPIATGPLQVAASDIARWEKMWSSKAERFEMVGGAGQAWTREERQAAATSSRQLTQDEPTPQTIYRIAADNKAAFMVALRLRYRN